MNTIELGDGSTFSLLKVEGLIKNDNKPYYSVCFHHGSLKLLDQPQGNGKSYPFEDLKSQWEEVMDSMSGGSFGEEFGGNQQGSQSNYSRSAYPGSRSRSAYGQRGSNSFGRNRMGSRQPPTSGRDSYYTNPRESRSRYDAYQDNDEQRWGDES